MFYKANITVYKFHFIYSNINIKISDKKYNYNLFYLKNI